MRLRFAMRHMRLQSRGAGSVRGARGGRGPLPDPPAVGTQRGRQRGRSGRLGGGLGQGVRPRHHWFQGRNQGDVATTSTKTKKWNLKGAGVSPSSGCALLAACRCSWPTARPTRCHWTTACHCPTSRESATATTPPSCNRKLLSPSHRRPRRWGPRSPRSVLYCFFADRLVCTYRAQKSKSGLAEILGIKFHRKVRGQQWSQKILRSVPT